MVRRDTKEYWEARVRSYLGTDAELASVTATGLPVFFARYTDWLERRTLRKALRHLQNAVPLLEVGCGYGRWFELWGNKGRPFVGVDFAFSLVKRARAKYPQAFWVVADTRYLPFDSGVFGGLCSVKVLQFLPEEERPQAIAELLRMPRRGGSVVLLEKIRDEDGSSPEEWIRWVAKSGGQLLTSGGNEFAPLDRGAEVLRRMFFTWFGGRAGDLNTSTTRDGDEPMRRRWARLYRTYLVVRRIVIEISRVLEPLMERILPTAWALHGFFVFRKT